MTQEEKSLLLQDFCARLTYGVKFNFGNYDGCDYKVEMISPTAINNSFPIEDCKPYLRPMSSMTEEEKKELQKAFNIKSSIIGEYGISSNNSWWVKDRKEPLGFDTIRYTSFCGVTDYLNSIHVDYRGLIDKGLAIEVTEENNPYKEA